MVKFNWMKVAGLGLAIAFGTTACGSSDNKKTVADVTVTTVDQTAAGLEHLAAATDKAAAALGTQTSVVTTTPGSTATTQPATSATTVPADPAKVADCVSTTDANSAAKSDVQRVGGENCAYTLRVAAIGSTGAVCATGWLCTLSFSDGVRVYTGDNKAYAGVIAGTVRFVAAYPSGDAVHTPCALTGKEDRFGKAQTPAFPVTPGNFTC